MNIVTDTVHFRSKQSIFKFVFAELSKKNESLRHLKCIPQGRYPIIMKLKDLLGILILNSLFINAINFSFHYTGADNLIEGTIKIIISGIVLFSLQSFFLLWLTKQFRETLFKSEIFNIRFLIQGILVTVMIWLLTQIWTRYVTNAPVEFPSQKRVQLYVVILVFNTIPAALIEELLFRHLPVTYGENKRLTAQQVTVLAVMVAIVFSISHISAYMVRDHIPFEGLAQPLLGAFFYGLAYFMIYSITRNIYLVTFIHAFSNNPLYLIDSPFRGTFYFYTYIFVIIMWLVLREVRKRRA